jgi:hypothetical protein
MRLANAILSSLFFICVAVLPLKAAEEGIGSIKKKKEVSKHVSFNAKAIDANRIACFIYNDGTFGVNPETGGDGCYFPAGQEDLSVLYSAGLWVLGKVQVDTLRMLYSCVSFYRSEFQPGIMLTDSTADSPGEAKYKVYKYAAGDTVEQDAVSQGCPGEVLGDQMLFSVYNDWRNEDYIWNTLAIGLEVHQTSFAWDEAFGLGHTIFSRYRIYNKGKDTLDTAYVAIWLDPDIGWANDDYAGCDTALDMIFAYNGDDFDEKYGAIIPAAGCDLLQGPIVEAPGETVILPDGTELTDKAVLGMTASFILCGNSSIPGMQGPQNAAEAYAFMQGMQRNGEPWLDPAQGNNPTSYPFAGDPVLGTGWLLEDALSNPNDIHMGIAAGPFTMVPGDSQDVVIALVVGRGTDRLNSIRC